MTGSAASNASEHDIAALNFMNRSELETRYRTLTRERPPARMTRSQLLAAVAYETVRQPHRMKARHVA